jgi:hypothetical protein
MLDAVAVWAGTAVAPQPDPVEDGFVRQKPQDTQEESPLQNGSVAAKIPVKVEDQDLPKPPPTFFKGTARLKSTATVSARENENISRVGHVGNDDSEHRHRHVTTVGNGTTINLSRRQLKREASESAVKSPGPMAEMHKRPGTPGEFARKKPYNKSIPAPVAALNHGPDALPHGAAPAHSAAQTTWPVPGATTPPGNLDYNQSAPAAAPHDDAWQPLYGVLPSQTRWRAPGLLDPANAASPEDPAPDSAAATLARARDWPVLQDAPKTSAVADEAALPSVANSAVVAQPLRIKEDPFSLSELEEQLADALERAAREAGIDIP